MKRVFCWLSVALIASLASAWGQGRGPQIGYVYPAGGERGTTFRIAVGGQSLRGADDVRVSGEGVHASVVEYVRALDTMELRDTEAFMRDLVRRRWVARTMDAIVQQSDGDPPLPDHPWLRDMDEKSPEELALLRTRLLDPKKQPNAQIGEQVEIEVTIDPAAAPGDRELRLITPGGLSNPLCFQVGTLREVREEDLDRAGDPAAGVVDLPVLLNGQITPGDVDRFSLRAKQGQKLVLRMQARRLIPYLADAVPGWFQATLALYGPSGSEVAYDDDYRFDPDPVLFYEVPADGVYGLEVRDSIYRGRDDFVYRVAVGELPFVTQMFPLGAQEGAPAVASITGWNLPSGTLQLDTRPGGSAIRRAVIGAEQGLCSEVPYAVDALPEATEAEPNDATGEAQQIALPLVVNGRIDKPGDVDTFRFEGQAGQEVLAEVYARRLNSPLDSVLRVLDAAGAEVGMNDDHKDPEFGLVTHQADSYLQLQLPADGAYSICVSDAQEHGGEAYAYRLRLGPPQPDFALRATPSSINVPTGRSAPITVHVLRRDGFDGPIDVALVDAPEGFKLSGGPIPAGEDSVDVTFTAPRGAQRQVFAIRLEGHADIGGVAVTRPMVPAEDMMQAFLYRHLVPRQEMAVAVTGARGVPAVWRPLVLGMKPASPTPIRIPLGGTAQVQIAAPQALPDRRGTALQAVGFQLGNSPRGVTLRDATVVPTGVTLTLKADANMALPGDSANLIIEAFTNPGGGAPGHQATRAERLSLGVLPAIPIEIVGP